jgi:hypothetical protein
MKSNIILSLIIICTCFSVDVFAQKSTLILEPEAFQNKGGWVVDQQFMDEMGSPFLLAHGLGNPVADAETTFDVDRTGEYFIWVRTRDWVGPWKKTDVPEAKRAS